MKCCVYFPNSKFLVQIPCILVWKAIQKISIFYVICRNLILKQVFQIKWHWQWMNEWMNEWMVHSDLEIIKQTNKRNVEDFMESYLYCSNAILSNATNIFVPCFYVVLFCVMLIRYDIWYPLLSLVVWIGIEMSQNITDLSQKLPYSVEYRV